MESYFTRQMKCKFYWFVSQRQSIHHVVIFSFYSEVPNRKTINQYVTAAFRSERLQKLGRYTTLAATCTLQWLYVLYMPLTPKLEYASVVWNSVTSTDTRQLELIQRKFAAQCQNHFFNSSRTYKDFLKNVKLHSLYDRKSFLDALFFLLLILV